MTCPDLEPALSRLTIRAAEPLAEPAGRPPVRWLRRLIAWFQGGGEHGPGPAPGPALSVSVNDVHGRQVYAAENAGPSTTVLLPPGTYHVLTRTPGAERRYTLVLDPEQSTDLRVRMMPGPR